MKDAGEEGDDEDTFFHEGAIGLILETKVLTPDRYQMQSDPRPLRALSETRVCRRDPLYNLAHLLYPDRTSTHCEVGCGRRLDYHFEVDNRLLSNAADSMSRLTHTTKRTTLCDLAK